MMTVVFDLVSVLLRGEGGMLSCSFLLPLPFHSITPTSYPDGKFQWTEDVSHGRVYGFAHKRLKSRVITYCSQFGIVTYIRTIPFGSHKTALQKSFCEDMLLLHVYYSEQLSSRG